MRLQLLLCCLALSQAVSVREKVNFDFSWRHQLGSAPMNASQPGFDDSTWSVVNAPHDMLIEQPYDPKASEKQAFIPRNVGWYRKHFKLPSDWEGSSVWMYVEGSFHETTVWLNGLKLETHVAGYTSFAIRLDTAGALFGDAENIVAVYVDASSGTGWWYEGGGLMRHNYLIRAAPVHIETDGAWSWSDNISINDKTATVTTSTTIENDEKSSIDANCVVTITDTDGKTVGTATGAKTSIPSGESIQLPDVPIKLSNVMFWSVQSPTLYNVNVSIVVNSEIIDSLSYTTGIRSIRWDADYGLFVNSEHVKLRGFCDHSTFGGVGSAVPDRVNLYRAQMLRSVGGNSWRMAHNPPIPARLDFMDRLGMLAVDENRDYGGHKGQGGTTNETVADELNDMKALVKRDRSHPSVMIWSFCNEVGCNNESSAKAFREVSKKWDPTRAVTQNRLLTNVSTFYLDVQGFSHKSADVFKKFHASNPEKPLMATECCSCMSQRGVDEDTCQHPHDGGCTDPATKLPAGVFYNNNIGECTSEQVAESDSLEYLTGTFVWSGFDYLGEARGWPQNTKCRGTICDVAGFYKETAYWLKSWWLSNISRSDAGRPVNPPFDADWTVFIIDSWTAPLSGATRNIHVYTNAPSVKLYLNGEEVGSSDVPFFGMATFTNVTYKPGNLTAVAVSEGKAVASNSKVTTGVAKKIVLSLDAPSKLTQTGEYLVADGEDTALIRATIVDESGNMVPGASENVTFSVTSGYGMIWATHNGDPANTSPSHSPWTPAYMGLARAFVRSTTDTATPLAHRKRMSQIDSDSSPSVIISSNESTPDTEIVVTASVNGIPDASISIPVTSNLKHAAINIAASVIKQQQ
eukprot:TRINITY_DN1125_c0_g4_i1.p1 TRINITY_DN1125_c0_g4~~TRINITY_DN1125_c0_g4_i1.p1  ORF type:complete len:860 (+),score=185.18 TRINITY_DN1125_c0_g4_i1:47-2626(+)